MYRTIIELIAATTTATGLTVAMKTSLYEKGRKVWMLSSRVLTRK